MSGDIIIKKSKISGRGIFANRNFSKGEIVLKWNPKLIKKSDVGKLSKKEITFVEKIGNRYYIMQPPERFMNHSCEFNTITKNKSDIAIKNIKKGEEITSNYSNGIESFRCKCGSKKCKKIIK
jgi:SET domain-containing protein